MSQQGPGSSEEDEKVIDKPEDSSDNVLSDAVPESEQQDNKHHDTIIDGRYKLHEFIGAGAMAVVYRGEHIATERQVAIKILSDAGDDESHARFKQEATAILSISHPHIVAAYDFGLLPTGESFLVMDLVNGTTLEKLIDSKTPLDSGEIINIALQVASGLSEAHRCGVLHRDLKPSNIMLVGSPGSFFVKIVDFGLAKPASGKSELRLTKTGDLIGTPFYMSPEQCAGLEIDARSDLYSLGCVLYELVTGEPPFLADNALRVLYMHINDKPKPFKKLAQNGHNSSLESIILKLLEKDKSDRFQTASELVAALDRSREKVGVVEKLLSIGSSRKNQRKSMAVAAVAVISTLGFFALKQSGSHPIASQTTEPVTGDQHGDAASKAALQNTDREQPELTWTRMDLTAQQAVNIGEYAKAKTLYDEGFKLAKSIRPQYELATIEGQSDLCALTDKDTKDFDKEIDRLSRESIDSASLIKALEAVHDKEMARSLIDESLRLATLLEFSGRYTETKKLLTAALAADEKFLPTDEVTKANCYMALAEVFRLTSAGGKSATELDFRMKAYALLISHQRDDLYQKCVYLIGRYYNVHEQPKLALPYLKKALLAATKLYGPASKQVAKCCNHLAICYSDLHQQTLANASAHEALTVLQSLKPEQLDADSFYLLAQLEQGLHRNEDALRDSQRSLAEYERGPSKNYPLIAECCQMVADLTPLIFPEREYLLRRELVILNRVGLLTPGAAIKAYLSLSDGYYGGGMFAAQKAVLQKAVAEVYKCPPHTQGRQNGIQSARLLAETDLKLGDVEGAQQNALLFKSWLTQELGPDNTLHKIADELLARVSKEKLRHPDAIKR